MFQGLHGEETVEVLKAKFRVYTSQTRFENSANDKERSREADEKFKKIVSTLLQLFCAKGNYDVVNYLLEFGGPVLNGEFAREVMKRTNEIGNTPLMLAAMGGHGNICCLLLEKGADVNLQNKEGDTALILATRSGKRDVVEKLLNMCGSWWPLGRTNKYVKNNNRNMALDIANQQANEPIVSLLGGSITAPELLI